MLDHPLLGDYDKNKFGGNGFAACFADSPTPLQEWRIAVNAITRGDGARLAIDDAPPEGLARRRYGFDGLPLAQIERMLPWQDDVSTASCYIRGPHVGRVEHVLGPGAGDYRDQGSTSQNFADCTLDLSSDAWGIVFDFSGSLLTQGFLRDVVPSLRMACYAVRFRMTWDVARFSSTPTRCSCFTGSMPARSPTDCQRRADREHTGMVAPAGRAGSGSASAKTDN